MSNNNNIPTNSAAHINRYVSGSMTKEEMHVFEKAMLEDPFLADAVEGFRVTDAKKTSADIAAIRLAINTKQIPFFVQYKSWLAVAASVIIIVLTWIIGYKKPVESSKTNEVVVAPKQQKSIAPTNHLTDTISLLKKETAVAYAEKGRKTFSRAKKIHAETSVDTTKAMQIDVRLAVSGKDSSVKNTYTIGSEAFINKTQGSIRSDSIINYGNAEITNAKNIQYADNNSKIVNRNSVKAKSKANLSDSLMPVGGWQVFYDYFNQKLSAISDSISGNQVAITDKGGNILKQVQIIFSLDRRGEPYDIQILDDIDNDRSKAIIEAIKKGPKWKGAKYNNKAKLVIGK